MLIISLINKVLNLPMVTADQSSWVKFQFNLMLVETVWKTPPAAGEAADQSKFQVQLSFSEWTDGDSFIRQSDHQQPSRHHSHCWIFSHGYWCWSLGECPQKHPVCSLECYFKMPLKSNVFVLHSPCSGPTVGRWEDISWQDAPWPGGQ